MRLKGLGGLDMQRLRLGRMSDGWVGTTTGLDFRLGFWGANGGVENRWGQIPS